MTEDELRVRLADTSRRLPSPPLPEELLRAPRRRRRPVFAPVMAVAASLVLVAGAVILARGQQDEALSGTQAANRDAPACPEPTAIGVGGTVDVRVDETPDRTPLQAAETHAYIMPTMVGGRYESIQVTETGELTAEAFVTPQDEGVGPYLFEIAEQEDGLWRVVEVSVCAAD